MTGYLDLAILVERFFRTREMEERDTTMYVKCLLTHEDVLVFGEMRKQLKSDGCLKFIQLLPLTINLAIRYGSV